jgi:hypothetical protein
VECRRPPCPDGLPLRRRSRPLHPSPLHRLGADRSLCGRPLPSGGTLHARLRAHARPRGARLCGRALPSLGTLHARLRAHARPRRARLCSRALPSLGTLHGRLRAWARSRRRTRPYRRTRPRRRAWALCARAQYARAGVRREVLRDARLGVLRVPVKLEQDRRRAGVENPRPGRRPLRRDEVDGEPVDGALHPPCETRVLEDGLREDVGLAAHVRDNQLGGRAARAGLRRLLPRRREGQPGRGQQQAGRGNREARKTCREECRHVLFFGTPAGFLNGSQRARWGPPRAAAPSESARRRARRRRGWEPGPAS